MDNRSKNIADLYGNKLRIRVNGLFTEKDSILMVKHRGIGPTGIWWGPPGGGMKFNENAVDTLKREFLEETGLQVDVGQFQCLSEFSNQSLHAVELFFQIASARGELQTGADPEMDSAVQIIEEVRLMTFRELAQISKEEKHHIFHSIRTLDDLSCMLGYLFYSPEG